MEPVPPDLPQAILNAASADACKYTILSISSGVTAVVAGLIGTLLWSCNSYDVRRYQADTNHCKAAKHGMRWGQGIVLTSVLLGVLGYRTMDLATTASLAPEMYAQSVGLIDSPHSIDETSTKEYIASYLEVIAAKLSQEDLKKVQTVPTNYVELISDMGDSDGIEWETGGAP